MIDQSMLGEQIERAVEAGVTVTITPMQDGRIDLAMRSPIGSWGDPHRDLDSLATQMQAVMNFHDFATRVQRGEA